MYTLLLFLQMPSDLLPIYCIFCFNIRLPGPALFFPPTEKTQPLNQHLLRETRINISGQELSIGTSLRHQQIIEESAEESQKQRVAVECFFRAEYGSPQCAPNIYFSSVTVSFFEMIWNIKLYSLHKIYLCSRQS